MKKFRTIGIGGQAAAGKDTLANYLVESFNQANIHTADVDQQWVRNAFANAVKGVFEQTFQVDRDFIEHWKRIPHPPEGFLQPIRDCLITIGDGFRKMKANIWIELAFRNQEYHQIISDLRYINEAVYIRDFGGITILLWRPGHENDIPNASEQELMPYVRQLAKLGIEGEIPADLNIPFDLFIVGESGVDKLYRKADDIVIPYLAKRNFI